MTPPFWLRLAILKSLTDLQRLLVRVRQWLRRWKQQRHRLYARKYGQRRANQLLPLQPHEYPADYTPLPDKEMGLADPEFYAATWPAMLKVALGLQAIDPVLLNYAGRWRFFKWAGWGLLLDWEIIEVSRITSVERKN